MTKNIMTENILLVYLVMKRTVYHGGISRLIINYDFIEIMTESRFFLSNGYF